MTKMILRGAFAALALAAVSAAPASAQRDSDVQRQIRQSIANYPGSCACPYNVDRGGRSCGRRSAYSRGGGHAPLCYPADVRRRR